MSLWHPEKIKFAKFSELSQLGALYFKRATTLGTDGGHTGWSASHGVRVAGEPMYSRLGTAAEANRYVYSYCDHRIARLLRMPQRGVGGKLVWEGRLRLESTSLVEVKFGLDYEWYTAFSSYQHAAIGYQSGISPNWRCSSYRTAQEVTTTTVAADTAWHVFRIEMTDSYVKFYIDNMLVATHTAQIPDGGFASYIKRVVISLSTLEAVTKYVRYEYVALWVEVS